MTRAQGASSGTGTLLGRVVDTSGIPVVGARASLDAAGMIASTDSSGAFAFRGVPAGRRVVTIQRLGYGPAQFVTVLAAGETATQTDTLHASATNLPAVRTQAVGTFGKPARLSYTTRYDGFYQRRYLSSGSGKFYTHEDLESMNTADLPDMLRRVPGLRLRRNGDQVDLSFPLCKEKGILIKVDGTKVWPLSSVGDTTNAGNVPVPPRLGSPLQMNSGGPTEDPLEVVRSMHLQNVEAIEVYETASSLPPDAVGDACGAIYIWTR
ncbi:MAG TPA: carboxypeptidase-like regulatory domain-containing protein [Gemmatimonadaceae bacterium]